MPTLVLDGDKLPDKQKSKSFLGMWRGLNLSYPGKFDDKDREAKEITGTTEFFEGMRIECQRYLSNNFSVAHLINMGGPEANGTYSFNTNYSTNTVSAVGRYDGDGRVVGRMLYLPTPNITLTAQSQVSLEPAQSILEADFEYKGKDSHSLVKLESKGIFTLSYMQSIAAGLAFGTELLHMPTQGTMLTVGGRYISSTNIDDNKPTHISALSMTSAGMLTACHTRRFGKKTEYATEYQIAQTAEGTWQDMWTAGCQWNFRASRLKARLDSLGRVGAMLEEHITPYMRMTFIGDLDHKEQKYKFGIGFSLVL